MPMGQAPAAERVPALFRDKMEAPTQPFPEGADMSLDNARRLAHNMRATADQQGDAHRAELAQFFHELTDGLERELRDIKQSLQQLQDQTRNLR